MHTEPLSDLLGADLIDFDVKGTCGPEEQAELRRLLCEHHLLAIRGQDVTEEDQNRFVGYFGPLHVMKSGGIAAYVTNRAEGVAGTGELMWHVDGAYGPHPGIATSLLAEESGDATVPTMFVNAVRTLTDLPTDLRVRVATLSTVHMKDTWDLRTDVRWREVDVPNDAEPGRIASQMQPIVYPMPHCGQETLFVSMQMTSHVVDVPPEDSEALLQDLWSRLYADDNIYRHHWRTNDLIIWSNMALHHGRPLMKTAPRHLRRQSLDGWYTEDGRMLDWPESVIPAPPGVIAASRRT